jgi:putative endonuclease
MTGWVVYILQCADGTLYTGVTNDLKQRLLKHESGTGAKYTRGRGPYKVALSEEYPDRSSAQKREREIKALDRAGKLKLINQQPAG